MRGDPGVYGKMRDMTGIPTRLWIRHRWPQAFLSLALLAGGCSRPLVLNTELVLSWSPALQQVEPHNPPYVAHFRARGRTLYYLASSHGTRVDSPTFRLIREVLDNEVVDLVIIEGYPHKAGVDPPRYLAFAKKGAGPEVYTGSEPSYAAVMAEERGISFVGGEPDDQAVHQQALAQGFTKHDLLGFYFMRQLPQFARHGAATPERVRALFDISMGEYVAFADGGFSFEDFEGWYQTRQGKVFDIATFDPAEATPVEGGPWFSQQVAMAVGDVRNAYILSVIRDEMTQHRRVFIIYGAGHLVAQRAALEDMLGPPKRTSDAWP